MMNEHAELFIAIGFFVGGYLAGWLRERRLKIKIIKNATKDINDIAARLHEAQLNAIRSRNNSRGTLPRP